MTPSKNILLFGPQGSGKGTQGEKLSAALNLPFIVTGNIFRQNIQQGTTIGQTIKGYINQGQLVPDTVTNTMISERLQQAAGVADIELSGGREKEIAVDVDKERLNYYGLTLKDIIQAIKDNNVGFFTSIPGLGKKTAMKILLELATKLSGDFKLENMYVSEDEKMAVDALISLGFKSQDAKDIIAKLPKELSVEEKIKEGIKIGTSHNK